MRKPHMTTAQPLSKTYQVDFDWAYDHYADFVRRFPNRWVAVANQRIVAVAKEPLRALRLGQKNLGGNRFLSSLWNEVFTCMRVQLAFKEVIDLEHASLWIDRHQHQAWFEF